MEEDNQELKNSGNFGLIQCFSNHLSGITKDAKGENCEKNSVNQHACHPEQSERTHKRLKIPIL